MKKTTRHLLSILLILTIGMVSCLQAQGMQQQTNSAMLTQRIKTRKYRANVLNKIISVDLYRTTLEQGLQAIAKKTGLKLVYSENIIPAKKRVSLRVKNIKLEDALWNLLADTDLRFAISSHNHLVLMKSAKSKKIFAQSKQIQTVSGTVTDAKSGKTLPGVNILVKGTSTGTSTNKNGYYELNVPSPQDTLIFSFIGYRNREISLNGRSTVNVAMQSQIMLGQEMVVVGYGTQKKSDLTGSVSSISSKDFNAGVNTSVDQLIQGRAAGVQISQTTGEPGGGISVNIRGVNSINAGSQPLYVVDGLPLDNSTLQSGGGAAGLSPNANPRNPLNSLNPSDIASIEILKDASATAIYGSRGSNGVVLITTKKGNSGAIQVDYNGYVGMQSTAKRLDILSTSQYIKANNDLSELQGNGPVYSQADIDAIGSGVNWQNLIYRTAPVTSHDISVAGGDENTTYRTSLNYFNQDGIVKNSGIQKYIAGLDIDSHIFKNGQMAIHLNHSFVKNNNNPGGTDNLGRSGPIGAARYFNPTLPVYDSDGVFTLSKYATTSNPLSLIKGVSDYSRVNRTFGNVYFNYDILKSLSAKISFGYDSHESKRDIYNSGLTLGEGATGRTANISTLNLSNEDIEYTMNYDKQLNENNSLKVLGGITYQVFNRSQFSGSISNFPSDETGTNNLGLGDKSTGSLSSNKAVNKLLSYLGRVNYSLYDKYLITASIRADGSSRFGKNKKYGYFPSFALAWKLSEENFTPSLFNQLKLRASWGISGNQEIGNYAYVSTFATGNGAVFNDELNTGISPTRIANPDLQWEATKQFDVGLDAGILAGRLSGSIDYFIKNTSHLLINKPLPQSSGFNSELANIGRMSNRGFDIQLNSNNIQTHNFEWNTTLNFSHVKNKVESIGSIKNVITGSIQAVGNTSIIVPGEPLFSYYGYNVKGIFQQGDNIAQSAQPNAQPGYPIFQDTDGDGSITPADRVILGSPYPDFTFGISNSLSYKNFQFSLFITGQQGADLASADIEQNLFPPNPRRNLLAEIGLNRWSPDNPNTKWPSGINTSDYSAENMNSLIIQDASYIRLRNVRLSYTIPQKFIQSAEVYITGQNLVTLTNYIGVNPDANALGRSNVHIDVNGYPLARTFLLGFNLHF